MFKKIAYGLFGNYFFDKKGISKKNIIANSYTPSFEKNTKQSVKLTSDSKIYNFFYWLYSGEKTNR